MYGKVHIWNIEKSLSVDKIHIKPDIVLSHELSESTIRSLGFSYDNR
jgi:hypothetical protein